MKAKSCLITGANRGIGLELTRACLNRGDTVIATARNPGNATALSKLKQAHPGNLEIHPLDVADASSFLALSARISGPAIDLLIVNAGISGPRGGHNDPDNDATTWARIFAVNVTGAFLTVRAVIPKLAANAKIALLSSRMASSTVASGSSYPYRASKAALANIGANLTVELKPKGIAVGIYHPGWVKTDMGGQSADITPSQSAEGLIHRINTLSLATTGVFEDYAGQPIEF